MGLIKEAQRALNGLKITDEMYRQARGNKMHMIVKMRPEDFIHLTTTNQESVDAIQKACKNLEEYNKFADEGETIIMPFLSIDGATGQIKAHEGRHRSAALACAGSREMPVAIHIRPTEEHDEKYGYFKSKYDMKFEDLPDHIRGEYGRGILDKKDLQVVVDGWENLI